MRRAPHVCRKKGVLSCGLKLARAHLGHGSAGFSDDFLTLLNFSQLDSSAADTVGNSWNSKGDNMKFFGVKRPCAILFGALACGVLTLSTAASAQWQVTAGAQSKDMGTQALAFLPNEIWIHAGDNVTWAVDADDIHTITFLTDGQVRPDFSVGCPGFSASGSSFDGSTCVTAPPMVSGQSFNVVFPTPGNYKLVCLVHEDMTGVVHVLDPSTHLPHDQSFYDRQAADERRGLLADTDAERHEGHVHEREDSSNSVKVGIGEVVTTGGGHQTRSVMRFLRHEAVIHVGETVEWTNEDSVTPHTITFGVVPQDLFDPSSNVTVDADGARHASISSTSDNVHSGFIVSAPQERLGLAQAPLGFTRFRVIFTKAGTYPFVCALHDNLGMTGRIIVLP
jgi:plastocyanin